MVKYTRGRSSRKKTVKRKVYRKKLYKLRNRKWKKFTRSKKHTLVCGPSILTGPQMPRILNAIRSSHSVSDNLIQDLRQAVDLSKDGTIYGEVMDHLKTMHTTGTNTPYINFVGIKIKALRHSVETRAPIIVIEANISSPSCKPALAAAELGSSPRIISPFCTFTGLAKPKSNTPVVIFLTGIS